MTLLAILGWSVAVALGGLSLRLRHRLELVARAEHELRGPLSALALLQERVRRGHEGDLAETIEGQLERARAGLADLRAARSGARRASRRERLSLEHQVRTVAAGFGPAADRSGRSLRLDWRAGNASVAADRGRLAQALGNLISNAIEHGSGEVEVRGRRVDGGVRVEVADGGSPGTRDGGRRRPPARQVRPVRFRPLSGGRGRGLTIASRAARDAGGLLLIAPDGDGTTAAIELPAEDRDIR